MRRLPVVPLLVIAAVLTCAGCRAVPAPAPTTVSPAPPPAPPVSPEEALKNRVTRFWDARLKDDAAVLYEFLEPAARRRVTLTAFVRSQGTFHFLSYRIQSIKIVEEKGWVKVKYSFKLRIPQVAGFGPWSQESFEVWTLLDGVWHRPYSQEEAHTPPPDVTMR